jgi:hypothetical protein
MTEVTAMKMTSVSESDCSVAPCVSLALVKLAMVSLQRPSEALVAALELSQMPAAAASHVSPAACCSRVLSARTAEAATAMPPANATLARDAIPEKHGKCKFIHLVCMSAHSKRGGAIAFRCCGDANDAVCSPQRPLSERPFVHSKVH